jgi:hypothetical protein
VNTDIRWKQRFENFSRAMVQLFLDTGPRETIDRVGITIYQRQS